MVMNGIPTQNKLRTVNKNADINNQIDNIDRNQETIWQKHNELRVQFDLLAKNTKTRNQSNIDIQEAQNNSTVIAFMSGDMI